MADETPGPPPPSPAELDLELAALARSQLERGAPLQTVLAAWRYGYTYLLAFWITVQALEPAARPAFLLKEGQALGATLAAWLEPGQETPHNGH
jgi:hypothetical protein